MKRNFVFLLMSLFLMNAMKAAPTDLPLMTTDLENPVYYTISNTRSTSGKYLYYAGDNVGLKDADSITTASLFFFTGSADACCIHNAATDKKVASVTSWTDEGAEWTIMATPYGDGTTGLSIGPWDDPQGGRCWNEFTHNDAYTTWMANDAGSIFVLELYGDVDIDITAGIEELLAANADNHAAVPALGQYATAAYEALALAKDSVTTLSQANEAIAAFEASKCLPVFTIDGVINYAAGKSIYMDGTSLYFKETDRADRSMLWTFDMTDTIVGVTDMVVVKNLATGRLFWNAPYIKVTETSDAVAGDGIFLFYTKGNDIPVHAQQAGQMIVRWAATESTSGSAWKFTFAGTTYGINDLPEVPDTPEGVVNNLASADPTKCYSITTMGRGGWAVDAAGTSFTCTTAEGLTVDESDPRQQFVILSLNAQDYYLYSVSAKKFVKRDGSLVAGVADAIEFVDASSMGAGRVMVRFDEEHVINVSDASRRMEINNWSSLDEGNAVAIIEAGDFDATEALDMLAKAYTITYEFTYDGEVKYTQENIVGSDADYPDYDITLPYGVSAAAKPEGIVDRTDTIEVELSVNLPFEYAENYEAIGDNWTYLIISPPHKGYLYYNPAVDYLDATKTTVDTLNKEAYRWAFVGNPFNGFKVVNKLAGQGKGLCAGSNHAYIGDSGHLFKLAESHYADGGFFMAAIDGENSKYLNKFIDKLAYWEMADAGSTFLVTDTFDVPVAPPVIPEVWHEIVVHAGANGTVDGGGSYEEGSEATLIATPNRGYRFSKWSNGSTSNPYVFTVYGPKELTAEFVELPDPGEVLIPFGQFTRDPYPVRYFKALMDSGIAPAEDWYTSSFDDSSWTSGAAPITNAPHKFYTATSWEPLKSTYWVRRTFNLDSIPQDRAFVLYLSHDDECTMYLNGHLVLEVRGWTETYRVVALGQEFASYLHEGENVIAAVVSNSALNHACIDFGVYHTELDGEIVHPDRSVVVYPGQYGRCILEGNVVEPNGSYTLSSAFEDGSRIKLYFVPFEGYTASSMKRNGETVAIRNNVYEEITTEDVAFTEVEYKTVAISDTIVVTETIVDTLVVTNTVVDTLIITEIEELSTPVITCENGVVTITCEETDVTILYAINGDPLEGSVYTAPFEVAEDVVVSAVVVRRGDKAELSVQGTGVAQSRMRVVSRRYYNENGVELTSPEDGVTIVAAEYEDGSTRVFKMVKK